MSSTFLTKMWKPNDFAWCITFSHRSVKSIIYTCLFKNMILFLLSIAWITMFFVYFLKKFHHNVCPLLLFYSVRYFYFIHSLTVLVLGVHCWNSIQILMHGLIVKFITSIKRVFMFDAVIFYKVSKNFFCALIVYMSLRIRMKTVALFTASIEVFFESNFL